MPSMPEVFQLLRVQNALGPVHQRAGVGFSDALAHYVARWAKAAFDLTQKHVDRAKLLALLDTLLDTLLDPLLDSLLHPDTFD